ncbi:MAG: LD-carboxypeptidase [Cyanobacteria bacterium SID2]|nr:LD-carboxypeptidase [Cyanobacteria bacterium SID2]MBP0006193.1 LD-carboxypeptidase [Cyanobacteria bacterium SBC]
MTIEPLTLPPALQPGDRLQVIAPSGCVCDRNAFDRGLAIWKAWGYQIELSSGWDDRHGYLAGRDEQRRKQLRRALVDPEVKGILCARGGYGGTRLLETWDWETSIAPKWLIGFSDITSLLWSLAKQGISGVHGPLLTTLAEEPEWSQQRLFDWVRQKSIDPLQGRGWGAGTVTGRLFPANLTVATHLIGTALEPDLTGAILAFEDIGEAPYRIDRMLTHWRMSGRLEKVAGIALGRFSRSEVDGNVPSFTADEVLLDRLSDLGVPVVSDLPFGHEGVNAALPVGVLVELNSNLGTLTVISD